MILNHNYLIFLEKSSSATKKHDFRYLHAVKDSDIQGTGISTITRILNLSHYTTVEKCQKLVDYGLMEFMSYKRNRIYIITKKGIRLLQEIQEFIECSDNKN